MMWLSKLNNDTGTAGQGECRSGSNTEDVDYVLTLGTVVEEHGWGCRPGKG